ncbi:endolytic transglycosylase MltG [Vibrio sonorensis]|uniref:endolytic transglycosylase MltG n=1 Tax=Vibrio sonorensis TaxID=1004316 RepID=UPI0008DA0F45|nr:endolytic transglycosylase MltG [Vibrio sonorensis]
MIKKLSLLLTLTLLLLVGGYWYVTKQVESLLSQPLNLEQEQIFTVKSGTSYHGLVRELEKNNWLQPNDMHPIVRRLHPELMAIRAGTYLVAENTSFQSLLAQLVEGKEHQFSITFVEGSRFSEWLDELQAAPHLEIKTDQMSEKAIADALGLKQQKLEGLFLAETYSYTSGDSDLDILKRANLKLQKVLDKHWLDRQDNLPLKTPYEALILASIIEKETAVDEERERVASVFVNRLNKRMRLQTDPTVIYGMGENYDGNIRKKDLRQRTDYNTYVIFGLPPTPIAMAGEASIAAALQPEASDYFYFVASGDGDHVFSKTLTEHNRAVRAYLKKLRSRK